MLGIKGLPPSLKIFLPLPSSSCLNPILQPFRALRFGVGGQRVPGMSLVAVTPCV